MQLAYVPLPLAFNASHGRPGDRRSSGRRSRRSASSRRPRTSTSGGRRASPSPMPAPTSPRCARPPCATATSTSSTARRPGPRSVSTATGSSPWSAPTRTHQEAGRHLVPADRHDHPRRHRPPDRADRRRPRGQRGLLRQRAGAGREPRRRGEPGLGLREVPARQRARRRRSGRRDQAACSPRRRSGAGDLADDDPLVAAGSPSSRTSCWLSSSQRCAWSPTRPTASRTRPRRCSSSRAPSCSRP